MHTTKCYSVKVTSVRLLQSQGQAQYKAKALFFSLYNPIKLADMTKSVLKSIFCLVELEFPAFVHCLTRCLTRYGNVLVNGLCFVSFLDLLAPPFCVFLLLCVSEIITLKI